MLAIDGALPPSAVNAAAIRAISTIPRATHHQAKGSSMAATRLIGVLFEVLEPINAKDYDGSPVYLSRGNYQGVPRGENWALVECDQQWNALPDGRVKFVVVSMDNQGNLIFA